MTAGELSVLQWAGAGTSALLVGLSKAGFGAGAGLLAVPLMAVVLGPKQMLPVMLLVLIGGDIFSIVHYPTKHSSRNLAVLLPGLVLGIGVGWLMLDWFLGLQNAELWMKRTIGALAVTFVLVQLYRLVQERRAGRVADGYRPRAWHGVLLGAGAGLSSTLAHAGGPLIVLYLLPQKLEKRVFVGTVIKYFFAGNVLKLYPYLSEGLMTGQALRIALLLLPSVVVGTFAGVYLNGRFSDRAFRTFVYVLALCVGLYLLSGWKPGQQAKRGTVEPFGAGLGHYHAERFEQAARAFAQAASTGRAELRSAARLNAGLAFCMQGELQRAREMLLLASQAPQAVIRLSAQYNLGNCALLLGETRQAAGHYLDVAEGSQAKGQRLSELRRCALHNLRIAIELLPTAQPVEGAREQGVARPSADAPARGGDAEADHPPAGGVSEPEERAAGGGMEGGEAPHMRDVQEVLQRAAAADTGPVIVNRQAADSPTPAW